MNGLPVVPIVWGVVSGIGWGLLGYGREKQKDDKITFSWKYFLKTLVIGAVVGAYAGYTGLPVETVIATPVIDKIVNVIGNLFKS